MYFLLAGVVEKFHYLKMGLAIVLTFIGAKMLVEALHFVIPIWISLIFVALVLLTSVAASLIWAKNADFKIDVDLPEDFDSPFEDDEPQLDEQLAEAPAPEIDGRLSHDEAPTGSDSNEKELENIERR
jgi:hypothetical protein